MPVITFDVQRAGLAEQFVQNLHGTIPEMLTQLAEDIKNDIAANAPKGGAKYNKKAGDVPLSASFKANPAQLVEESTWQATIESSVPAKARAIEYGSGLQGPKMSRYYIPRETDIGTKRLAFRKEGKLLVLPFVKHPGVYGQFYINETLRVWRPALRQRFGEAIRLAAEAPVKVYPIGPSI